jgi:hypothetical protein
MHYYTSPLIQCLALKRVKHLKYLRQDHSYMFRSASDHHQGVNLYLAKNHSVSYHSWNPFSCVLAMWFEIAAYVVHAHLYQHFCLINVCYSNFECDYLHLLDHPDTYVRILNSGVCLRRYRKNIYPHFWVTCGFPFYVGRDGHSYFQNVFRNSTFSSSYYLLLMWYTYPRNLLGPPIL